ncbi:hypothetical protein [Nocardioides sp. B-3]|uniref:hypothetical protein n=1 Tax=Nocardioides sp. B-3 TaxID=2895565 RepID=UPI0021528CF8|nr:hypothetical protein [Nocardioides sp. B-3]UUZ61413.1 hypothetical protein LP418_13060 [Nocardioides sp. B-3]
MSTTRSTDLVGRDAELEELISRLGIRASTTSPTGTSTYADSRTVLPGRGRRSRQDETADRAPRRRPRGGLAGAGRALPRLRPTGPCPISPSPRSSVAS